MKLRHLLQKGLSQTRASWPPIREAYAHLEQAAEVLRNDGKEESEQVKRRYQGLLGSLAKRAQQRDRVGVWLKQFVKVTRSYWPGLFHCYAVKKLPRTNNDLEQLFGSHRYHERRSSGRKQAAPGLVVRGSVRLWAAVVTRAQPITGYQLAPTDIAKWRALRARLRLRQATRALGRRFRHNPERYLAILERRLKVTLPP